MSKLNSMIGALAIAAATTEGCATIPFHDFNADYNLGKPVPEEVMREQQARELHANQQARLKADIEHQRADAKNCVHSALFAQEKPTTPEPLTNLSLSQYCPPEK